ncbi:winged helix DNA-binding domain-containing protein [Actinophytocola sp.]|uniref:winged helix DNA-binding domain-containing protein n=1 Tax=Actinophytocola sp. TaxID=1872138 RepID=UPI002DDCBFBC|nr:winged helix DNA-binding domain-containing protein [Actinophytocola sp.]
MQQRRVRLARRHLLAAEARAPDPVDVARAMVALHGTDPTTVYLSAWARMHDGDATALERALYEDRTLLRLLCMRRTVFVLPTEVAPIARAACSLAVAARERRQLLSWLSAAGIVDAKDAERWLAGVEEAALRALAARGEATAAELSADDPRLRAEIVLARGKAYEGKVRVGSRVLLLLAAEGRVVRGRPLGSWTSTQFRWSPAERWWPGGLPDLPVTDAEAELARRWLATFGPATVDDLRWWTGWAVTPTRRALARIGAVEVDLDGRPGLVLPDDLEPEPEPEPWVALLPALDPTPMGWTHREFYLGGHGTALFDRTGNVSPTVWCDGRIVGGWAQRRSGEIAYRLLDDVGSERVAAIERAAAELTERLGPVRLSPRARTASPVERELLG